MGVSSITDPEIRAFLTEGTRTGKLSFLSSSGHPLVTPVWFVLEGDTVVLQHGQGHGQGPLPGPRSPGQSVRGPRSATRLALS